MAAPKELKSPGAAGRPQNVASPVPSDESEMEAMRALSESDLADLKAMSDLGAIQAPSAPLPGIRPKTQQYLEQLGLTGPEGQVATPFDYGGLLNPTPEMKAEMAGGMATQVPPAMLGAGLGAPLGPIGVAAGGMAGAMLGAGFTKDAVNKIRQTIGLPEDEERSRATDVLLAGLFSMPGIGAAAGKELSLLAKEVSEGAQQAWAKTLRSMGPSAAAMGPVTLSEDVIGNLTLLKQGIKDALGPYVGPEEAAKAVANIESDYVGMLKNGMSEAQAAASVAEKYSFQVRANQARTELLNNIGEDPDLNQMIASGIEMRPGDIIPLKEKLAVRRWSVAEQAIRQTKGLNMIDSQSYIPKLLDARDKAAKIGRTDLVKNIDDIVNALGQRDKLNEMAAFTEQTGGKAPQYYDMKTGKRLRDFPQTQEPLIKDAQEDLFIPTARAGSLPPSGGSGELTWATIRQERPEQVLGERVTVYPKSEQLGLSLRGPQIPLTAEEKAARLLPSKLTDNLNSSAMQSVNDIIERRVLLDRQIDSMAEGPTKEASIQAVSALRGVEDDFLKGLQKMGGQYGQIADDYLQAKASIGSLKDSIKRMGNYANKDPLGVAESFLNAPQQEVNAFAKVMPEKVRRMVARKMVEKKLNITDRLPDRPYTEADWKALDAQMASPEFKSFQAKLNALIGPRTGFTGVNRAENLAKDLKIVRDTVQAASRLPEGKLPQMNLMRKASLAIQNLILTKGGNTFVYGRLFFPPDTRSYKDFINFMVSKDFDSVVKNISSPREALEAGSELSRLFGKSDPRVARFYDDGRVKDLLMAGQVGRMLAQPSREPQPGAMQ